MRCSYEFYLAGQDSRAVAGENSLSTSLLWAYFKGKLSTDVLALTSAVGSWEL